MPFIIGLLLIGSIRIVSTYTVFNHTSDEPNHIACGMEWLQNGTYSFETQHPPLARVAAALGPYLIGARVQDKIVPDTLSVPIAGTHILYRDHRYDLTLALARLGILPFFWIACVVVYWWARRCYGTVIGIVALFLFSFLPPILAHAGLATTDMALTAFMGAAFVSGLWWLEQPTLLRGAIAGACAGLAVLSKYSSLPFLAASIACAAVLYVVFERPQVPSLLQNAKLALPSFGVGILVTAMVIWSGFRFSIGSVAGIPVRLPAPELFSGIQSVAAHNRIGHHTYLLGNYSVKGFWYYYPIVLGVKTPLAVLVLFGFGLFLVMRKNTRPVKIWQPLGLIAGVLAIGLYSRINIGVRHILPVYMAMSMMAAVAIVRMPEWFAGRRWGNLLLGALLAWFAGSSLFSHPDYLPYFNELAGSEPEKIVVDSDLDWGQDIKRLGHRLNELGATRVAFFTTLIADLEKEHGFPHVTGQDPFRPSRGWNAVSLTFWKLTKLGILGLNRQGQLFNSYPGRAVWPDEVPRGERVGKSILLWEVDVTK